MTPMISAQSALVHLMVAVSASDNKMTDAEMARIGEIVRRYPIFEGYNADERLIHDARTAAEILQSEDEGLDTVIGLVREALPVTHRDTAYEIAAEIATADVVMSPEEDRILDIIRDGLGLDRLSAAAIDRALLARRRRL